MNQWTRKRQISLIIHAAIVAIPFTFSTVSSLLLWQRLFDSWLLAVPLVAVVDVLALLGLVLQVVRIASPFTYLRHLLPFISIVPLGIELYALLEHNGPWVAWPATVLVSGVLVVIAWQCFTTIERLFIDPVEAARERAREQVDVLTTRLAQLREMEEAVDAFTLERLRYHMPSVTVAAVSADSALPVPAQLQLSKSQQVKALASQRGISESTVWRKVKSGEIDLTAPEE